ncbi:MAG: NAD(P)H-dependent oxidoreductase [Bdellovibrionia bacterium]
MDQNQIISALNWRYATKKYDSTKKLKESDWQTLAEALRLAPSSYGLQPWKFLVVQNPELRAQLRPVSWGQSIIEDCSHLIVFTTREFMTKEHIAAHIEQTAKSRGVPAQELEGYKTFMEQKILNEKPANTHLGWNQRQAYIAMGFLLETAALMKIDATPVEGIDPDAYDKILNLQGTGYKTVAVVTLGYRHAEDGYQQAPKSRFDLNQILEFKN